jgi:hypothetical protein
MLLAVGVTQGADAITFVRMVRDHGTAVELNPLVARLAAAGELAWLLILKAALVVLVVAIFAVLVRRHVVVGSLVATLAVMAGIVGAYSNVAVIVGPGRGPLPL